MSTTFNPAKYAAVVTGEVVRRTGLHPKNVDWTKLRKEDPSFFKHCVRLLSRVPNGSRASWYGRVWNANR